MENQKRIIDGNEEQFNLVLNKWVAPMVVTAPYEKYGASQPYGSGVSGVFGALFQKRDTGVNEFLIQGRNPANDGFEWLHPDCTAHWVKYSGTTSQRPTWNSGIKIGFYYFDTDLGKPVWVKSINGNIVTWVDATGATV